MSDLLDEANAAHLIFASTLIDSWDLPAPTTVTWLNHSSAQVALSKKGLDLSRFDYVGIDGKLLEKLVRGHGRTSADLVVPQLLKTPKLRIAVIGGTTDSLRGAVPAIEEVAVDGTVVYECDGFTELAVARPDFLELRGCEPDLVLVGLGAGLQEEVALEVSAAITRGLVLTCGGFLDQVQQPGYYPKWAYPLRLNWLVRLAREPRRLYRRYTLDAVEALLQTASLRGAIRSLAGFMRSERILARGDYEGRIVDELRGDESREALPLL